jgi:hypothetical protein
VPSRRHHRQPVFGQWRRWESHPSSLLARQTRPFGTCVPNSCGGRIRTGVERLMKPCWKPGSSPLRNTPGRTRTCEFLHVREAPSPLSHGSVSGRQESNLPSTAYQTVASPLGFGPVASALDGTRTRLTCSTNRSPHPLRPRAGKSVRRESHPPIHLGKVVPWLLGHGHDQQGRKESNLLGLFWRQAALPGARPCKGQKSEVSQRIPTSDF